MTDRDTFAAAALTGLLASNPYDQAMTYEQYANESYRMADAMIRERGKAVSDNCVTGSQREMEYPVTEPMPKEKRAEVSFTLTDEERDAVKLAADFLEDEFYGCSDKCAAEHNAVATLRKLLERLS